MTASEEAKAEGFESLKEMALLCGKTTKTLRVYFDNNQRMWEAMLRIGGQRKEKEERYNGL